MLRRGLGTAVTVLCLLALFVQSSAANQVTITLWDAIPLSGRDVFLELIREFEEQNPNIKVEVEQPPGAYVGVLEKTTVALAGGVPPNIIHLAHAYSYAFRELGVFMSLNDYIAADPSFEIEDWYPPFLDAVSMDGHIYGIPYNLSTVTMYYSPFRLEASGLEPIAPTTWDEVVAIGSRVTRDTTGDGVPDIWATDAPYAGGFIMEAWVGQSGATYVNEDRTEVVVNSPEGVRAYEFLQDLIHTHGVARFAALPEADLFGGRVGWFIRSSSNSRRILDTARNDGVPLSIAPLPCGERCYVPIGGGALYAIDTGTPEQRDATYKLLSFLGQPDNLARYAAGSGYMAPRKSALSSVYLQDALARWPEFWVSYEQLAHGYPETSVPEFALIQGLFSAATPILRDNQPAKPILDDIARRGTAILQEYYAKQAEQ